jgi:hypothetical protein
MTEDDRYYAINSAWVQQWVSFVENRDWKSQRTQENDPPGPIDNEDLEKWII